MFKDIEQDEADRIYMLSLSSDSPSIPLESDSYMQRELETGHMQE